MVCRHSAAVNSVRGAASATANHCAASAAPALPSSQPSSLDCFACPRLRLAKALRPRPQGLQHRDLALLPPAVAPHPQVELIEAAAVACVRPRIGGRSDAASFITEPIGDGGLRVAPHEARIIGTLPMIFLTWQSRSGRCIDWELQCSLQNRRTWAHIGVSCRSLG